MTKVLFALVAGLLFCFPSPVLHAEEEGRDEARPLNVLFIMADDMRPTLGCYGDAVAVTPNLDRLAQRGTVFKSAYCQQALCAPSRVSMLTGRRPETVQVYDLETNFRDKSPDITTLPQHFKNNGYHTQMIGKIFHAAIKGEPGHTDEKSWSAPWWTPRYLRYHTKEGIAAERAWFKVPASMSNEQMWEKHSYHRGLAWEAADVPDEEYGDAQLATRTIEVLREVKDKPFFLAVGFYKPHLPFVAPKKYFDLYPLEKMPLAPNPDYTEGTPLWVYSDWDRPFASAELRSYTGIDKKSKKAVMNDQQARELSRAYYACVSFVDAQVGRLLDALDELKLADNTIIVFLGDHGYHLGDNGIWGKGTNFEFSTRSPLIFAMPEQKNGGQPTKALVEFVDIYPSLAEACRLPVAEALDGTSFLPLLDNPEQAWKKAAFSVFLKNKVIGRSMRTERYRITSWPKPKRGEATVELYDYEKDSYERRNLATDPQYTEIKNELLEQLKKGWKEALPVSSK